MSSPVVAPVLMPLRITIHVERVDGSYTRDLVINEAGCKIEEFLTNEGRVISVGIGGKPAPDPLEVAPKGRPS